MRYSLDCNQEVNIVSEDFVVVVVLFAIYGKRLGSHVKKKNKFEFNL